LPLGIAAVAVAFKCLPYQRINASKTFDFPGFITVLISSTFIILSFTEGNGWGWTDWKTLVCLLIGVATLIYFIRRELSVDNPLLNLSVFRTGRFTYSLVINCIITASLYSGTLLIPVFVQDIQQSTPLVTALVLLPGSLVMALCSPVVGKLYSRTGPFPLIVGGIVLLIVSNWELSHISLHATHLYVAAWMTIRYVGIALAFMPVMNAGMSSIPKEKSGHASSVTNWVRQATGALSIGIFSSLLASRSITHQKELGGDASASVSASLIREMGMTMAVQDVFLIAAFICAAAIPLTFALKEKSAKRQSSS
jgi:predicted MFS family arabinose efflux permease